MRVGISISSTYPGDDHRIGPAAVVAEARAAAEAGLDTLTMGDHHSSGPMSYVQNVPMIGRVLAEWDARPAGCLFLVPLWHPVLMAEQIGTLAAIAEGPFIVQAAMGGGGAQFAAMGVPLSGRRRRLEAGVSLARALLAGETEDCAEWGVSGARIAPLPQRGVEWWIGADAPPAVARAASLGDCWYANASLTPEHAETLLAVYREACARVGRTPTRLPIRKDVFVAESAREAEAHGDALLAAGYRGFERSAVAYGDPAAVAEQLAPFADLGFTDVVIRTMPAPPDAAVRSVLLAGEVRELLRAA
jgi:alkanesulfonate monooxygenase SsuD/methylene tetrahydromethanopterin reductase-like flavin-dependent oxidoreductase (luciferase family)